MSDFITSKHIPAWMLPAAQVECPQCGQPPQHYCVFESGNRAPNFHPRRSMAAHAITVVETPYFTIHWKKTR